MVKKAVRIRHILHREIYRAIRDQPPTGHEERGRVTPEAPGSPLSASGPSYTTRCTQNHETDLKTSCTLVCARARELRVFLFTTCLRVARISFWSHSEGVFFRITRTKNLLLQQAKRQQRDCCSLAERFLSRWYGTVTVSMPI